MTVYSLVHLVHKNEASGFNTFVTSTPAPYSHTLPMQGWKEVSHEDYIHTVRGTNIEWMPLNTNSLLSKDVQKAPKFSDSLGTPIGQPQRSLTIGLMQAFEDVDDAQFEPDGADESSSEEDSLPPISHVSQLALHKDALAIMTCAPWALLLLLIHFLPLFHLLN